MRLKKLPSTVGSDATNVNRIFLRFQTELPDLTFVGAGERNESFVLVNLDFRMLQTFHRVTENANCCKETIWMR
jgi:hypothetical protein